MCCGVLSGSYFCMKMRERGMMNCGTKHRGGEKFYVEEGMSVLVCAGKRGKTSDKGRTRGSISPEILANLDPGVVSSWCDQRATEFDTWTQQMRSARVYTMPPVVETVGLDEITILGDDDISLLASARHFQVSHEENAPLSPSPRGPPFNLNPKDT